MSNEKGQPPGEDLARSRSATSEKLAASDHPQNGNNYEKHSLPQTDEGVVTTNSSYCSPTPPERTSSARRPTPTPDGSPVTEEADDLSDVPGKKKKRSLLNVPSRSSSHHNQPSPTSTQLTGATASDPAESIGKGSKSSITGKRRQGSVSSSQRSGNAQHTDSGGVEQPGDGQFETEKPPKQNKAGVSRFLGFLNCCSVSGNANSKDGEDVLEPPKRARFRSIKNRQKTPVNKRDVGPEPSTADSKDHLDEKAAFSDSDKPAIGIENKPLQGVVQDGSVTGDLKTGKPDGSLVTGKAIASSDNRPQDQPSPAIPVSDYPLNNQGPSQRAEVKVVIQAPTPIVPQQETGHVSEHHISPSKSNDDIEMVDAPGSMDPSESTKTGAAIAKIGLPPPPTIDNRAPTTDQESKGVISGPSTSDTRPQQLPPSQDGSLITPPEIEKHQYLLPPIDPLFKGKKCLVLDLDETLVHSSFKILHQADFTIPVEIEGQYHNVYVIKRPGVDQFMKRVGELYEVVVFTASVSKDLSQVGRDLRETIIIDNSPTSYIFHPQHAVPISSWFSDAHDNELLDLIPVLEDLAGPQVRDVSLVLDVAL
ncbi:hypothetical protein FGG08_002957 [Glutinoglossum americanum]|uniref:Mitochondrial import inner membrane translocase subunit TIM50 n=1 Tax=Glutinoglossum americanum TaxID=1670608 RepID=A0A9P8HZ79_9PEZI|nr:hypothetical protein FGG08_002957 [Glutinoglossum americanum]